MGKIIKSLSNKNSGQRDLIFLLEKTKSEKKLTNAWKIVQHVLPSYGKDLFILSMCFSKIRVRQKWQSNCLKYRM